MNPIYSSPASANRHQQLLLLEKLRRLDQQQQQQQHRQLPAAPDLHRIDPTMGLRRLIREPEQQTTKSAAGSSLLGGNTSLHQYNTTSSHLYNQMVGVGSHNRSRQGNWSNLDTLQIIEETARIRGSFLGSEMNDIASRSPSRSQQVLGRTGAIDYGGMGGLSSKVGGLSSSSKPSPFFPSPSIQSPSFGSSGGGLVSPNSTREGYGKQLSNMFMEGIVLSGRRRSPLIQQQHQHENYLYEHRNKRARTSHNCDGCNNNEGSNATTATTTSAMLSRRSNVVLPSLTSQRSTAAPMTSFQNLWDSSAISSYTDMDIRKELFIRKVVHGRVPIIDNSERLPRGRKILVEEFLRRQSLLSNPNNQSSEMEMYMRRMV